MGERAEGTERKKRACDSLNRKKQQAGGGLGEQTKGWEGGLCFKKRGTSKHEGVTESKWHWTEGTDHIQGYEATPPTGVDAANVGENQMSAGRRKIRKRNSVSGLELLPNQGSIHITSLGF